MARRKIMAFSSRRFSECLQNLSGSDFMVISDSSDEESQYLKVESTPISKKKPSSSPCNSHASKRFRSGDVDAFKPEDMHLFWGTEQKSKFLAFKNRPIVLGRVIDLEHLEDSHCALSTFFKAQNLSQLFQLCGRDLYEQPVCLFYANLRVSKDSGELETLVLGNHIVVNDFLFEKTFGTKFSGVVPFMNGCWPEDFEVTLQEAKAFVAEPGSDLSDFGPSTICFENRILAHIIATSLLPRKGSLSSLTDRDVFVLYCLLKKYEINWAAWFREYMVESAEESGAHASLPYGLIISSILVASMIDLSDYKPIKVSSTYDTRAFANMGYVLNDGRWSRKGSVKVKVEQQKASEINADSASELLKEAGEIKGRLTALEDGMQHIKESLDKILQATKDTSTDVEKLRLAVNSIQGEGIKTESKLINLVYSNQGRAGSS